MQVVGDRILFGRAHLEDTEIEANGALTHIGDAEDFLDAARGTSMAEVGFA